MPDEPVPVTEAAPVESTSPQPSSSPEPSPSPATPQEHSSNDSVAQSATAGDSVSKALDAFAGQGFRFGGPKTEPGQSKVNETGETQPVQPTRTARDYSGLDESEQRLFKSMSNDAFNTIKPQYLEAKALKVEHEALKQKYEETTKSTFFDQDGAYQITPEYQHSTANLQLVDREITFWKQQISAIRNGQKWTALTGYDDKGNPKLVGDQEPTPEAEADIVNALINAHGIRKDLSVKVDNIRENFTTQHKKYLSNMASVEKEIFKGVDQETLKTAMSKKITMFPEHRRSNPEVQVIAKLLAVLDGYQMLLNERDAAKVTAEQKTKTAVNGGPTGGTVQHTLSGKTSTAGAAMDEFSAYKASKGW